MHDERKGYRDMEQVEIIHMQKPDGLIDIKRARIGQKQPALSMNICTNDLKHSGHSIALLEQFTCFNDWEKRKPLPIQKRHYESS
jgi:hypothetical protein